MSPELCASYQFCGRLARRQARNFYYGFLFLPPARRRSMCALYAFLRQTDDIADEPGPAVDKQRALDAWRSDLDATVAGRPAAWPGFAALADTIRRHGLPARHLHDVIDGVRMDLEPRTYRTFDELYRYCYHVASAVGLSCLPIWGYRSDGGKAEALAESCGIALQLTNILRDLREDHQRGRVYLPQEDLERFGVVPDDFRSDRPSEPLRALLAFEAERAAEYYRAAVPLASLVAPVGRPVLLAIVGIYRALLDEIARRNYNVLAGRVALPPWKKLRISVAALGSRFGLTPGLAGR